MTQLDIILDQINSGATGAHTPYYQERYGISEEEHAQIISELLSKKYIEPISVHAGSSTHKISFQEFKSTPVGKRLLASVRS